MNQTPVTHSDLIEGFRALGLSSGDVIFMHSSHHCIHSQAGLDDIPPGDTRKRIGKVFFAPEGLDQLYERAAGFFGFSRQ